MMELYKIAPMVLTGTTTVSVSDFQGVIDALTSQISVSSVVGVLTAVVGICIGLVFMWWGVRKALGALMSAFKKGKASL